MLVLIADDEGIIRMGLQKMLRNMGHDVLAATNGREALQMARRHQPDFAILDIQMPFTDGLQAAKTLSQTQPLPILILTAFSDRDMVEKAADLPIHGYLIKPIQAEALEAAMIVAVKRFTEQQALQAQTAKLEKTLALRKLIDKAKGVLMAKGMTEQEAYLYLQKKARDENRTIVAVAKEVNAGN
jgi:response regulator NasT